MQEESTGFSHPHEPRACGACKGSVPSSPHCWLCVPEPLPVSLRGRGDGQGHQGKSEMAC